MAALAVLPALVTLLPRPASAAEKTSGDDAGLVTSAAEDQQARRPFSYGRAATEIGVAMALGVTWYESQIELNKLDFDFDRTWQDQTRRLFSADGYRFDDNDLTLNVGHAFMGLYYHQFARANGGSLLQAIAFDLVTSSVWELTVEHREVISLNDQLVTGLGGIALGESLYQMGDYFARSAPTLRNRLLMSLLSPAHLVGWATGDRPRAASAGWDRRGLAVDGQHRFAFSAGGTRAFEAAGRQDWQGELRLDLELVDLRGYGRPARARRWLDGGELTRLQVEYRGGRDLGALSLGARTSLWGWYRQDTRPTELGGLRGQSTFLGTTSAFELAVEERTWTAPTLPAGPAGPASGPTAAPFTDFLTTLHLIGPMVDHTLHLDRLVLRLRSDLTGDFAMVRPFGRDPLAPAGKGSWTKSTLRRHDYYYALGLSATTHLEARYRRLRAGAALEWNQLDSIEGLDRHQEAYVSPTGVFHPAIAEDTRATDQRVKARLFGELAIPFSDLRLGATLDYQQRQGELGGGPVLAADDLRLALLATYQL